MIRESQKYQDIAYDIIENTDELKYIKNIPFIVCISDEAPRYNDGLVEADCALCEIDSTNVLKKYCYRITIYEPNCRYRSDRQRRIIIEHELHHIGADGCSTNEHDTVTSCGVGEFKAIVEKYGESWNRDIDSQSMLSAFGKAIRAVIDENGHDLPRIKEAIENEAKFVVETNGGNWDEVKEWDCMRNFIDKLYQDVRAYFEESGQSYEKRNRADV